MKYQLHDCEMDSFVLENDSIVLSFPNGFYAEDDHGTEIKPFRHKLVFTLDRTCCPDEPLESFVFIRTSPTGTSSGKPPIRIPTGKRSKERSAVSR